MVERVPSDHPSVDTYRGELARSGGTSRPCLRLPDDLVVADGDVIRLVVDGAERYAQVRADRDGRFLRGAFHNRAVAREPGTGENHLLDWLDDVGRGPGESVDLDVVDPGDLYGVRAPGDRVVYEASPGPDDSLASIAEDLGFDG
ncbi:MAG: hypothetical protein ABEJ79_02180 [Halolamina sp.]